MGVEQAARSTIRVGLAAAVAVGRGPRAQFRQTIYVIAFYRGFERDEASAEETLRVRCLAAQKIENSEVELSRLFKLRKMAAFVEQDCSRLRQLRFEMRA